MTVHMPVSHYYPHHFSIPMSGWTDDPERKQGADPGAGRTLFSWQNGKYVRAQLTAVLFSF